MTALVSIDQAKAKAEQTRHRLQRAISHLQGAIREESDDFEEAAVALSTAERGFEEAKERLMEAREHYMEALRGQASIWGDLLRMESEVLKEYPCDIWEEALKNGRGKFRTMAVEQLKASDRATSATDSAPTPALIDVPATPSARKTVTYLSGLYLSEQEANLAPASIRDMKSAFKTLAEALTDPETGVELDLKHHTREDMVNLKSKLMDGRKPLTVNKLLTRLNTLVTWAINSGYLEKAFNKGLKISKGAESGRKAFTEEQIHTLMDQMAQLPVSSWKRWAMSLGVITGGRIGEIYQLTKADVLKIGDVVVVSINDNESKTLKNKHSNRLVPLVDGAYGFDLKAFLEYVETCEGKLFDRVAHNFTRVLNETLRDTLQHDSGEGLTYHSLRHSLAGLMKYHGVQMEFAQSIMGHSSQSITFDLYGGSQQVGVQKLEAALRMSFGGAEA